MRIVLVGGGVEPIPPTGYGGTERFIADLARSLRAAGEDVVIINRVRHHRLRDEYPFAWELPRLLRHESFDVVHANSPVVANRLAFAGIPYVYTSHSRHWYYRERLTHRWGYWLERRAVRRSAGPVALTEPLARTMQAAVGPTRRPISVIPFGVDGDLFRPDWEHRSGKVALGVGVVAPFKRWEVAAEALRGSPWKFVLVGRTSDRGYADRLRAIGPHVELAGEVSDAALARHFAESDLLLHPSRVELLSGAVVQGLSAGLPVLGGSGVRGVVDDGRTGWVIADEEPTAFVTGLRQRAQELADQPALRRQMGDAARASAQDRFSWPRVVERYVELYRTVAETGRASP